MSVLPKNPDSAWLLIRTVTALEQGLGIAMVPAMDYARPETWRGYLVPNRPMVVLCWPVETRFTLATIIHVGLEKSFKDGFPDLDLPISRTLDSAFGLAFEWDLSRPRDHLEARLHETVEGFKQRVNDYLEACGVKELLP